MGIILPAAVAVLVMHKALMLVATSLPHLAHSVKDTGELAAGKLAVYEKGAYLCVGGVIGHAHIFHSYKIQIASKTTCNYHTIWPK